MACVVALAARGTVRPCCVLPREESISYLHYLSAALMKSIYLRYRFLMGSRACASLVQQHVRRAGPCEESINNFYA